MSLHGTGSTVVRGSFVVLMCLSVTAAQGNTTFTLTTSDNGHLGTQFTMNCAFTYADAITIVRSVHFYRKRDNDPTFAEIARAVTQQNPQYVWNDTALRDRSTPRMISRTQFQITVSNLECRDRAEYRCKYFAQDQNNEYHILSEPEQLEITAPPRVPELTFSPSDIVENEPVQFSCTGNVGLPAGSLRILVVKSNGQEVDLNANQGLVEVEVNGCTFERTATASFNFTAEDDDRSRVRCRVEQTYADNQHRTETEPLRVMFTAAQGNTTFSLTTSDNGHLGTQFTLNCAFTYADAITIVRSVHFYRKRDNDPNFVEIARAVTQQNPQYVWNDTALQDRSTPRMISRTQFQIKVNNLECRDRAEYRCKYLAQDQNNEYHILSEPEQLEITAPPRVPELTFSPSDIVENEPVQFSCTGNVGLPAGSLRILVVKSNGQEVDLNANQGLVEVEVNGCTFERTATASFNFTAEDDDRSRVRCRVEQTYADNQHRTETEPLRVMFTAAQGNTTFSLTTSDNGHLGTQFTLNCAFTYADAITIVRSVHFYRKRDNDPNFVEIARAVTQQNPQYVWNDTALQDRSTPRMISRTQFQIKVNNLECRDRAEYRCKYLAQDQNNEYHILSEPEQLEITAPPRVPELTFSPSDIVENEPVQFSCTGNVGLPAGSLRILVVKSNGQEVDLNANQGLVEVEVNGCTFERTATASFNFTAEDDDRSRVRCRVEQTYADNQHRTETEPLRVMFTAAQGNTTFSLTTSDNGHLGTQFTMNCAFTYANAITIVRSVHFYRKRDNDPNFVEIARAVTQQNPQYVWNDTALRDRSTPQMISRTQFQITVNNLECRDRAEYRCKYFAQDQNNEYHILSEPEQLEITAPPRVPELTFSPSDIVENEPVQFSCTGNVGLPAGSLRILVVKSNGQEVDLNANQGLVEVEVNGCTFERTATASFNFTAEDDDRSRVRCRVEQTYADNQHHTETEPLRVMYAPRGTTIKRSVDDGNNEAISPGQTVEVPVKSNVLLICETQSSPAALYEWSYILTGTNDTLTDSRTNSGQFRLDSIALDKSGQYRCKVSNNIRNVTYTDEVFFKLNVSSIPITSPTQPDSTPTPSGTIPVTPGQPVITAPASLLTEGNPLSLNCTSSGGNPKPSLIWKRNGQVAANAEATVSSPESGGASYRVLNIQLQKSDHQAIYTCEAFNEVNEEQPATASRTLQVRYSPRVSFSPYNPYVSILGDRVTLKCEVDAYPTNSMTYRWEKDGVQRPQISDTLLFSSVEKTDNGTYTCTVSNGVGQGQSESVVLDVQYKPEIVNLPSRVIVNQSDAVNITCASDANPRPRSTKWTSSRGNVYFGSNLVISSIFQSESDNYTCEISNVLTPSDPNNNPDNEPVTKVMELLVQHPPGEPVFLPLSSPDAGDRVELKCQLPDPGYPAGSIEWQKEGRSEIVSVEVFVIQAASLSDSGTYMCRGKNLIGTGVWKSMNLIVNDLSTQTTGMTSVIIGSTVGVTVAIVIAVIVAI